MKITKISIVSIVLGAMLFSCENDISVVQSLQLDANVPIETSYNVKSIITDSGRVRIRLFSPRIDHYIGDEEYTEMPEGVEVIFYDSLGEITSSIKADYAINSLKKNRIIAKYNVVATNSEGEKLYTEKLIWDKRKRKIFTDEDVKVESADKVIFGDGLTADESFDNWVILHPHGDFETDGLDEDSL